MKIVYSILGTYNAGGMERVLANKVNYLARLGYELVIITTDQRGRKSNFEMDSRIQLVDLAINYTDHNDFGIMGKYCSFLEKQGQHRQRLSSLLHTLKADIVISMFDHDATFLHSIKDGSKKVLEIHFSRYKRLLYGRKGLWSVIDHWRSRRDLSVARKYDRFVVLTNEDSVHWKGLSNIAVIPNANSFSPVTPAALVNKRAIAVGRFDYQKGFDRLIYAWTLIAKRYPDWTINIYGEGALKGQLQKQIQDLGLGEVVFLCEPTSTIVEAYLTSSLAVMTSRYEGLPMALLEAQACGLPMVSFACKCGPEDIIRNGKNGFLIVENDIENFVDKVCLLLKDNDRRLEMGRVAYEMSENFSEDRIMRQWIHLFESLRKGRELV